LLRQGQLHAVADQTTNQSANQSPYPTPNSVSS
jgi:hypothetical protein